MGCYTFARQIPGVDEEEMAMERAQSRHEMRFSFLGGAGNAWRLSISRAFEKLVLHCNNVVATTEIGKNIHMFACVWHMEKCIKNSIKLGQGIFLPTNQDLADILGRTDCHFARSYSLFDF